MCTGLRLKSRMDMIRHISLIAVIFFIVLEFICCILIMFYSFILSASSNVPRYPNHHQHHSKQQLVSYNSTYTIDLNLPRGEHKVNIFAHNPVGWSENPQSHYFLRVVSGAHSALIASTYSWFIILFVIGVGQLVAAADAHHFTRFFIGSLLQI